MLNIKAFAVNMIRENCYVVSDETNDAVIIDCGAFYQEEKDSIDEYIGQNSLNVKHLLCTHGHFDHIIGDGFVAEKYGIKPELNAADARLYNHCGEQMALFLGEATGISLPPIGKFIDGTSVIEFGSHTFAVIPTPGHLPQHRTYRFPLRR